jgi:hypothetical protein
VSVEKVPQLMLVAVQCSGYKQLEFSMLLFTIPFGGLLLMMGHQSRSEALFYYFRLEDQVPENHLLRLIDRHVNFEFIRAKLKDSYSDAGRPSIDPELLLRLLLVGYLYGVTSERKLVEELRMHLAWRWFTGLASIRRFRITPRFLITGMVDSRNRICFRRSLRRSSPAA